ncbi:MAG: hypothetical protein OXE73_15395 [Gammaproteobacteria bacterium]|nr:hypothetical protein [Gammaproteobacteria bacterium]
MPKGQPKDYRSDYRFIELTLRRYDYHNLAKKTKTSVRKKLMEATGLSRAQITRLIRQHRETGRIMDGRKWKRGE